MADAEKLYLLGVGITVATLVIGLTIGFIAGKVA